MRKAQKKFMYGLAAICLIGLTVWGVISFWPVPESSVDLTDPSNFSLVIIDGVRGDSLDKSDIQADLFGLPIGEDATDWAAWEEIDGITDAADIGGSDLDTDEYSRFVMNYSSTGVDAGSDEAVVYYMRMVELYQGRANVAYLYETPNNGAGFVIFNTNSLAGITLGTIAANVNFTVVTFINATQSKAKYVEYWDYTNNELATFKWTFTANATCVSGDLLSKNGLTKEKPAATTIRFVVPSTGLGATPIISKFEWGSDPSNIVLNALALTFAGNTV